MRHALVSSCFALAAAGIAAPANAAACADLAKSLQLPNVTVSVAEAVAAGKSKPSGPPGLGGSPVGNYASLPAFCRVAATSRPTPDSDIRFEVWMPLAGWNGKFVGGGNGVWAGSIAYSDMTTPLSRGYATAASDVGHQGSPLDGSFLTGHPEKLIDFGHRAVHETTVAAKAIIAAFYGSGPKRSLYASCSTGGRIGLMEAYRYPADYDGISAVAPANPMVPLMIMSLWTGAATMKDETSRISPPLMQRVQKAAMEACDAGDGVQDGIINHPPACGFDPSVLQCKAGVTADCLAAPQLAAIRAIYAGPKNPRTGKQIYPGLAVGSEAQMPVLTMGQEPFPVATTFFKGPVFNDQTWSFRSFDYDKDTERALDYGSAALDIPPTGLDRYFKSGRKLLLTHGWSDGLIPAQSTVNFYEALVQDIGKSRAKKGVRLFMAPGMGHCAGGAGPSSIDYLGAIDQWVETGKAPERLIASNQPNQSARTRPLCPHPQIAKYTGQGSIDDAMNFSCTRP
jgi:feruloyl esterase